VPPAAALGSYQLPLHQTAGTFANVTLRYKSLRRANHHVLLFPGNTKFRQRRQVLSDGALSNFHKCKRIAIVTDEIDFTLNAERSVIPGYEYVPLLPQIPVCLGFSSHAGAPSFLLFRIAGKTLLFAQAAPRSPVHGPKHQL